MLSSTILPWVRSRPELKEKLRRAVSSVGYDPTDWVRVVMYQRCFAFIRELGPEKLDALEISAGPQWSRELRFKSYTGTQYPGFDICSETLPRQFDLVIADQVFEHLKWPYRAGKNVYSMLKPGAHFVVTTPFLVRIHKAPIDCTRWTEEGMSYFLQECGFDADHIETASWGNRACIVGNFKQWSKRGFFGSLANEPDFPVMVWAFAQKPHKGARHASGAASASSGEAGEAQRPLPS